jgi:iron complex transport system ATP-binding protein
MEYTRVSYTYKGESKAALSEFSLKVPAGKVVALLGPNGSGKSTALGIGASWLKPVSGAFAASGGRAFLPQTERLAFSFSCLEYVVFGRAPHLPYLAVPTSRDHDIAAAALQTVGMADKTQRRITALSGGELQLVRIARALAQEAPFMILDEPTDMLDPAHVVAVGQAMRAIAEAGGGVLMSTHDIAFALSVADSVALLKDGHLMATGPADSTLTSENLAALYGVPFSVKAVPTPVFGGATGAM